ncbi:ABC transporter ATP-binding protein [Mycoplasmopsis adleri]|uniref:ABC transporter ATP-binding protein n=1 Tax=Mycoplasmopsis adleri TaxID=51362 RepID=UPI0038732EAB
MAKYKANKAMFAKAKNYETHKPADDIALSIQHLTKIFKIGFQKYKIAANDISFEVKKGQFHGFIGDNGAGKTATIRSILGFYPNIYGKIYIGKYDSTSSKSKTIVGYIPEVALFSTKLTVREYLYYCARMSKIPAKEIPSKIDTLLKKYEFDLPELDKSPSLMSSGQKKTVLLMQALLNDPEILIFDEPAANLDPSARIRFYAQIKQLHLEGKTILISSHILDELEKHIDSCTVLSHGRVIYSGWLKDIPRSATYNLKMKFADNDAMCDWLDKNKIPYELIEEHIYCRIDDESIKSKMLNHSTRTKNELILLEPNTESLGEIYFNKKD